MDTPKPIEITEEQLRNARLRAEVSYVCMQCGLKYHPSKLSEAITHAAMPLSHEPLPRGVVYRSTNLKMNVSSLAIIDSPQIYQHNHQVIFTDKDIDDLPNSVSGSWEMDDTILRFQGRSPMNIVYSLLSPQEFNALLTDKPTLKEDVMRLFRIPEVLRTHPMLEAIIADSMSVRNSFPQFGHNLE
jgi:hypothetical protein